MLELQPIKPKHSDGSKNPFKDGKEEFAVDKELNEIEVLGRYDSILRALVLRGYFKLYEVFLLVRMCDILLLFIIFFYKEGNNLE